MTSLTLAQIKTRIKNDLDLLDEEFVNDSAAIPELTDYINEAIDEAEAEIHTIYEDYFLTRANLTVVASTQEYALPTDIYANKIRKLLFNDGSTKYIVNKIKKIEETMHIQSDEYYRYLINNVSGTGYRLRFYPTIRSSSSSHFEIWYIRNAKRLSADADVCDIPEFVSFVIQFAKMRCLEKEGHPNVNKAVADTERIRKQMIETLSGMIVDEDDQKVMMDLSFYEDFDSIDY